MIAPPFRPLLRPSSARRESWDGEDFPGRSHVGRPVLYPPGVWLDPYPTFGGVDLPGDSESTLPSGLVGCRSSNTTIIAQAYRGVQVESLGNHGLRWAYTGSAYACLRMRIVRMRIQDCPSIGCVVHVCIA